MTEENGQLQAEMKDIELSIELAKKKIDKAIILEKLYENDDFQQLIVKDFMEEYAVRMVKLRAHPTMQGDKEQRIINEKIQCIGTLNQFFQSIFAEGSQAEQAMENATTAQEEVEREIEAQGNEA